MAKSKNKTVRRRRRGNEDGRRRHSSRLSASASRASFNRLIRVDVKATMIENFFVAKGRTSEGFAMPSERDDLSRYRPTNGRSGIVDEKLFIAGPVCRRIEWLRGSHGSTVPRTLRYQIFVGVKKKNSLTRIISQRQTRGRYNWLLFNKRGLTFSSAISGLENRGFSVFQQLPSTTISQSALPRLTEAAILDYAHSANFRPFETATWSFFCLSNLPYYLQKRDDIVQCFWRSIMQLCYHNN